MIKPTYIGLMFTTHGYDAEVLEPSIRLDHFDAIVVIRPSAMVLMTQTDQAREACDSGLLDELVLRFAKC